MRAPSGAVQAFSQKAAHSDVLSHSCSEECGALPVADRIADRSMGMECGHQALGPAALVAAARVEDGPAAQIASLTEHLSWLP